MEVAAMGNDASSSIPTQTQIQIGHQEENQIPIRREHDVLTRLLEICIILLGVIPIVIGLLLIVVGVAIVIAIALPLVLMSLIVVRLLQIVRHGDQYERLSLLKFLIRTWIMYAALWLLFGMGIFHAISTRVTSLKHVILIGLPLSRWVSSIGCMICGVYCLSYVCEAVLYLILVIRSLKGSHRFGVLEALTEIINCLLFLFAETRVMKLVPEFKNHKILGLYTKSWFEVTVFVIIGYNVFRLLAYMILPIVKRHISKLDPGVSTDSVTNSAISLLIVKILFPNYLLFCVNWLRSDITFILTSIMILLTWVLYFTSHLSETDQAKDVSKFGTRTCISLLIFSLLWLIKRVTLLIWETNAIYSRLSSQILEAGKHLYFLGIITRQQYDILNINDGTNSSRTVDGDAEQAARNERLASNDRTKDSQKGLSNMYRSLTRTSRNIEEIDTLESYDEREEESTNQSSAKKLATKKRKRIKQKLLLQSQTATLYDIEQVGRYLLATKNSLSKEMDFQHILDTLKTMCSSDGNRSLNDSLKQLIDGEDNTNPAQGSNETSTREERKTKEIDKSDFEALLTHLDFADQISYENLGRWMETKRNNCVLLANTIKSAKEVANCLNQITSLILVVAAFIMWLLLTGLATTKVLVLIASPLLAATFIFGDTCKSLFQGIIFVFVVHPFHVGDLCVINDKLMEVKAIGIWTTTFSSIEKVGTLEEVIYPNSKLAAEVIINHKTVFDCNDSVEFNLASFDDQKIETLKSRIEHYFNDEDGKSLGACHTIAVLTTESSFKITVTFEHNIDLSGNTFFECVKKKNKLRSAFVVHVQNLINKNGVASDPPPNTNQLETKPKSEVT